MTAPSRTFRSTYESPVGPLGVEVDAAGRLVSIAFGRVADDDPEGRTEPVVAQLREYFAGERRTFDLELAPASGTEFQRRVWTELASIPYGETRSYGELARALGSVARAVGGANGANPIPIVVPCHRVIQADGSLGGFGGGVEVKQALLELEGGQASLV